MQTLTQVEPQQQTTANRPHAVFFQSESLDFDGLEDQHIYAFESEQAALDFVFDKLVETGHIVVDSSGYLSVYGEACEDKSSAVDEAQTHFSSSEYFHIYPLKHVDQGKVLHPAFVEELPSDDRQPYQSKFRTA